MYLVYMVYMGGLRRGNQGTYLPTYLRYFSCVQTPGIKSPAGLAGTRRRLRHFATEGAEACKRGADGSKCKRFGIQGAGR